MKLALVPVGYVALMASPAMAGGVDRPSTSKQNAVVALDCQFDLAEPDRIESERAMQADPVVPRGTDTRRIAWNPPAVSMALAEDGPVLSAGALGRTRKGVPGLAHVVIGWDF